MRRTNGRGVSQNDERWLIRTRVKLLTLTYSIADQNFQQTKSVGILNLSVQLPAYLIKRPELGRLTVLSNRTLDDRLELPPETTVRRHDVAVSSKLGRVYWDQLGVYRAARELGNEWLFLPKGFASFCRRSPVKLATCVADANHDYYQEHYPGCVPALEMWYFQRAVRATIRHSSLIFTISDFTTSEVLRLARKHGFEPPPVRTIGIGFTPAPLSGIEKQNRILVLAGRWPHKRSDLALAYLDRWQSRTNFPGTVEWVGRLPDGAALPDFPRWRLHARLPEAEFRRLIAEARTVVYFSDYEGFGMPPVEALIAGTNAVYSDVPALREVMNGAGHSFANASCESFENALDTALRASPDALRDWAAQLLARHNWDKVADRVVKELLVAQAAAD
jgi:glycosyltransferase involved in cell wall biosynthesis